VLHTNVCEYINLLPIGNHLLKLTCQWCSSR